MMPSDLRPSDLSLSNNFSLLTYEEKEKILVHKSESFDDLHRLLCNKHDEDKEEKLVQNSKGVDDISLLRKSFKRMHWDQVETRANFWETADWEKVQRMYRQWGPIPKKKPDECTKSEDSLFRDSPATGFGPVSYDCSRHRYPFRYLVELYALVGLHWYNMLEGTNLMLHHLETIRMVGDLVFSFDINLLAHNPDSGSQELFGVDVSENRTFLLDYRCIFAGTADTPKKRNIFHKGYGELPEWPIEIALNDRKRFYVMEKPELCSDLMYLYLRLVICAQFRLMTEPELSYFDPVEVVVECIEQAGEEQPEPLSEILNKAKSAILYISFNDSRTPVSDPTAANLRAIVRRVFNKDGFLDLDGLVLCELI